METHFKPAMAALGLSASLALAASAHAQSIRIALAGPYTGPLTQYGEMIEQGARTAVEIVNAAGGVRGKPLEIVLMDDGCEPKQAPTVANRIINDGIGFVVGHACSGASIAASDIYDNNSVVMITASSTAPVLTDGKNFDFIFRTIGRDDQQGPAAADFIMNNVKPKRIAVLHDKQSYGQGIATAAHGALKSSGADIAMFEGINAGDSDYSAVITRMKSLGVDFVYFGGYHPEMGLLLRQSAEQNFTARYMGSEGAGNPALNAIAGDAAEGMMLMLPADMTRDPANASIVQAFLDKNRDPGGAFQLTAYSATIAIAQAIAAVGEDTGSVARWLHANNVDTPIGRLSWNQQGDLNAFKFDAFMWHKDGSKSLIE